MAGFGLGADPGLLSGSCCGCCCCCPSGSVGYCCCGTTTMAGGSGGGGGGGGGGGSGCTFIVKKPNLEYFCLGLGRTTKKRSRRTESAHSRDIRQQYVMVNVSIGNVIETFLKPLYAYRV